MCKYCTGWYATHARIVRSDFVKAAIRKRLGRSFLVIAADHGDDHDYVEAPINYCPMCGRKLGGDE